MIYLHMNRGDTLNIRSQIVRDLSTEPQNDSDLLSRISALNVIIDTFNVGLSGTKLTAVLRS